MDRLGWTAIAVASVLALGACGGDGDGDDEEGGGGATESTTPTTDTVPERTSASITRKELQACLREAGEKPQNTADVIVSSGDEGVVRAVGVEFSGSARVVFYVMGSASSAADAVQVVENTAPEAEVTSAGNVIVAYLSEPPAEGLESVEACLPS